MTLQEAHTRLIQITAAISSGLSAAEVRQLQTKLLAFVDALPTSAEFDPTAESIRAAALQLDTQLTQAVLDDLKTRTAILGMAVAALTKVSNEAAADARVLSFTKPKLVAAGLLNSLMLAQQLQHAAKQRDFEAVAQNAETLLAVLATLRDDLKIG